MSFCILSSDHDTAPRLSIPLACSEKMICKGNHSSKGDGICDDINNNLECGYDGNDCCGPNVNKGWIFFK